ncbi:MAG: ABC transporter ATP-binding protein [Anaerolineae bacterium]|nr:ABC transporter ATP-binding protein [Anaerolineae bacterium]
MAYLELQTLDKMFGTLPAVRNLSLAIEKGEFVSLLGPSGCGKTTTLRMIAGFESPDSGQIILDGQDITQLAPNKRGTGMVFQAYALFPNMSVYDNVAFGLDVTGRPKAEIDARVREMLALVRLEQTDKRRPHELSGGQQQRIALARALAIRPRVLLLDEPLSALDAVVRVALRSEIRRIQSELNITTVYVTHDQEEALSISDRVVVMREGVIEQMGTPEEIYRTPQTRFVAAFIGTANQLEATVDGAGTARFHQTILRLPSAPPVGSKIALLVRPESLAVHTTMPADNGRNLLEGVVQTMTFLGAITRIEVLVQGERVLADVSAEERVHLAHKQQVWLSFAPDACQVMQVQS